MSTRLAGLLVGCVLCVSCQSATSPSSARSDSGNRFGTIVTAGESQEESVESATGGGLYLLLGTELAKIHLSAVAGPGGATGSFSHSVVLADGIIEFHGNVTCLSVDPVNHRAWIGGVITANASEDPSFHQPIHQVGRDIWFRVLDNGQGPGVPPDRTTFVGFEGSAGIITSEEYCQVKPWPDDNARTWPVTRGNIQVTP